MVPDYKQMDYDDISGIIFFPESGSAESRAPISYRNLFSAYLELPIALKEMIEWCASVPYGVSTRFDPFFNANYWKLFHSTILIERIIGESEICSGSLGPCAQCGYVPWHHNMVRRKAWIRQSLEEMIGDKDVVAGYAQIIDAAYDLRNKLAPCASV